VGWSASRAESFSGAMLSYSTQYLDGAVKNVRAAVKKAFRTAQLARRCGTPGDMGGQTRGSGPAATRLAAGDRRRPSRGGRLTSGPTARRHAIPPCGVPTGHHRIRARPGPRGPGWPLWGALVWFICEVWLNQVMGPVAALTVSTAAFVGAGAGVPSQWPVPHAPRVSHDGRDGNARPARTGSAGDPGPARRP